MSVANEAVGTQSDAHGDSGKWYASRMDRLERAVDTIAKRFVVRA
jgi:hypothetical protein